jgi:hypothetical protein
MESMTDTKRNPPSTHRNSFWAVSAVLVLAIAGCEQPQDVKKSFLYLTSDVPDGTFWQVNSDFRSTSDRIFCKTFSFGSGKLEPSVKRHTLKSLAKGETLKVPLFWEESSSCNWEMIGTTIEFSRLETMPKLAFAMESDEVKSSPDSRLPDSIHYICAQDGTGCITEGKRPGRDLVIPVSQTVTALHMRLEYR